MIDGSKRGLMQVKDVRSFLNSVLDEDIHTKRVASLANAALGVMTSTIPSFFPMIFQYVSRSSRMGLQDLALTPPVKSDGFTRAMVIQARACLIAKRSPSISK